MQEIVDKIKAKNAELDATLDSVEFTEKQYSKTLEAANTIRRELNTLYKELNVYIGTKDSY